MRKIVKLAESRILRSFGLDLIRDVQLQCATSRGRWWLSGAHAALPAILNQAGPKKAERFGWTTPQALALAVVSEPGGQLLSRRAYSAAGRDQELVSVRLTESVCPL